MYCLKALIKQYQEPLSTEVEQNLVQLAKEGDQSAVDSLVLSHYYLVLKQVRDFSCPWLEPDLINEGIIGLLEAIRGFNSINGARLASYAVPFIRGAISRYIMENWSMVKLGSTRAHRKLFFKLVALKEELTLKEIADEFKLTEREVLELDLILQGEFDVAEMKLYSPPPSADKAYELGEQLKLALKLIKGLPEEARQVLLRRLFEEDTLEALAMELGLSKSRVWQIERETLSALRVALEER